MADWRNQSGNARGTSGKPGSSAAEEKGSKRRESGWQGRSSRTTRAAVSGTGRPNRTEGAWSTRHPWLAVLLGLLSLISVASFLLTIFLKSPKLPIVAIKSDISPDGRIDLAFDPLWDLEPLRGAKHVEPREIDLTSFKDVEGTSWKDQLPSEYRTKNGMLAGGGPSRRVTLFLVSTTYVRKDGRIWLVTGNNGGNDPFNDKPTEGAKSSETVALNDLLEAIGKAIDPKSYAWIALDIHPGVPVSNLADVSFPIQEIEKEFNGLEEPLRERLFVTLPCSEGQNNLLSPILQKSIFSHFFTKGLATGFRNDRLFTLRNLIASHTLQQFHDQLANQVSNWTSRYLHASQTPKLLGPTPEKTAVKVLSTANVNTRVEVKKFPDESPDIPNQTIADSQSLLNHWEKMTQPSSESELDSHEWRYSPLETARKEALLILAEQTRSWSKAKVLVGRIKKELMDADAEPAPSRSQQWSLWEPGHQKNKDHQKWNKLVKCEPDEVVENLREFVDQGNADLRGQEPFMEWVFAKSLRDAIDWIDPAAPSDDADGAIKECLTNLINNFDLLQEIAYGYQPEVLHVAGDTLLEREKEFLDAYDLFVQQNFQECKTSIDRDRGKLNELRNQSELFERAFAIQKDFLHAAPHLLAVCERLNGLLIASPKLQANDSNREQFSTNLVSLLKQYHALEKVLTDSVAKERISLPEEGSLTNIDNGLKGLIDEIDHDLHTLIDEISKHFDSYKGAKSDEVQRIQIGLTWPYLAKETRETFEQNLPALLNSPSDSTDATNPSPNNQLDDVQSLDDRDKIAIDFFKEDPRFNGWVKEDWKNANQTPRGLYQASVAVRLFALPLAQNLAIPSDRQTTSTQDAQQAWKNWERWLRWRSAEVRAKRLHVGMWGTAELNKDSLEDAYVLKAFHSLQSNLGPSTNDLVTIQEIDDRLKGMKGELENSLKSLSNPVILVPSGDDTNRKIQLSSLPKDDIRRHGSLHRERHQQMQRNDQKKPRAMTLSDQEQSFSLPDDEIPIASNMRLSFRGNTIPTSLEGAPDSFQIDYSPNKTTATHLTVTKQSDPIDIAILIDCSASMNPYSEDAKRVCRNLLGRLTELSKEGQIIHLAVFPFAITELEEWGSGEEVATYDEDGKEGSLPPKKTFVYGSEFEQLDDELRRNLVEKLDRIDVSQSGALLTPLYQSLTYAKNEIQNHLQKTRTPSSPSVIVVISDGVNFGSAPKEGFEKWKSDWLSDDGRPPVFLYQFEVASRSKTPAKTPAIQEEIIKGEAERSNLFQSGVYRNREGVFKTFDQLEEAVVTQFPSLLVNLEPGKIMGEASSGRKIPVQIQPGERNYVWITGGISDRLRKAGDDCSGQKEVVFAPGDHVQLDCSPEGLKAISFQSDRGIKALTGLNGSLEDGEYRCKATATSGQLQLRVGIDTEKVPLDQPRRPEFCCAIIRVGEQTFPLADIDFRPGTHHPLIEFAPIRFPGTQKMLQGQEASYSVWVAKHWPSDEMLAEARLPLSQPDSSDKLNDLPATWKLEGTIEAASGQVTIRVLEKEKRWAGLLFCRNRETKVFAKAIRKFTTTPGEQQHVFKIPSEKWGDYEVVCLSEERLKELEENKQLSRLDFAGDQLRN
jgi:hypothetical protein